MKKAVGMSPIVIVLALLAGAKIAGIAGIILAVPVAVALQEMLFDWENKKLMAAKQNNLKL
jgi:predicted PurR-regulated permease PerM